MIKTKPTGLMLAKSLDNSRVPLYLSKKSELETLAEGFSFSKKLLRSNSNNNLASISHSTTNSNQVSLKKSVRADAQKSSIISKAEPSVVPLLPLRGRTRTRPSKNITKGWGGSTQQYLLGVEQGTVFMTNKFRPPPESNSFEITKDLGSPGATRRWVLSLEDFRDNEISFRLQRNKLLARGYQTTRKDSPRSYQQSITLPNPFCIDCLKVYRNKQIGAIIIALLPHDFPLFKF